MEYIEWFLNASYRFLELPINIFGFIFRFVDIDLYIMLGFLAVHIVRRLLDY